MNVHSDRLSRKWDPRDLQISRAALQLVKYTYRTTLRISKPIFSYRRLAMPVLQPTHRHDIAHNSEDRTQGGQRNSGSTGLAELNLVPRVEKNVQQLGSCPDDVCREPLRRSDNPEQLEVGSRGDQRSGRTITTTSKGLRLRLRLEPESVIHTRADTPSSGIIVRSRRDAAAGVAQGALLERRIREHLQGVLGDGPETRGASRLLANRPISKKITRKATQLASFDRFMRDHGLSNPVSGVNLACWIVAMYEGRLHGTGPYISASSLPGY